MFLNKIDHELVWSGNRERLVVAKFSRFKGRKPGLECWRVDKKRNIGHDALPQRSEHGAPKGKIRRKPETAKRQESGCVRSRASENLHEKTAKIKFGNIRKCQNALTHRGD